MSKEREKMDKWRVNLGLISPTFYKQLLYTKIPKAQKETDA